MYRKLYLCQNQLWVIKGVDQKTGNLIIELLSSACLMLVDAAYVHFISADDILVYVKTKPKPTARNEATFSPAFLAPEPYTEAYRSDISHKRLLDARTRYFAVSKEVAGGITAQAAAEMCGLSLSRYQQIKRLYDPQVGFPTLLGQRNGRRPKASKPKASKPEAPTPEAPTPQTPIQAREAK